MPAPDRSRTERSPTAVAQKQHPDRSRTGARPDRGRTSAKADAPVPPTRKRTGGGRPAARKHAAPTDGIA
eukprot:336216-Alexandrium_andersonii.AAC.1